MRSQLAMMVQCESGECQKVGYVLRLIFNGFQTVAHVNAGPRHLKKALQLPSQLCCSSTRMGRRRRRIRKAVVVDLLQTKVVAQRDAAQNEVTVSFCPFKITH
jgi:hypothetical protein